MMIRRLVRVGQVWEPNDPRRFGTRVVVTRIVSYETGRDIRSSLLWPKAQVATANPWTSTDRVHVINHATNKRSVIRRDQFMTGNRGWSLVQEAV